ncbi:MAG: hypothetical protein ACYCV7_10750 [Acidimicrobiales bacterium]
MMISSNTEIVQAQWCRAIADLASGTSGGGELVAVTDVVNNQELECWAAWIVAAVLAGRPKRRDPSTSDATHDYDVCLSDRVVALEVTRAAVREVRAQQAAITSASWDAPGLTNIWTLQVAAAGPNDPGAHIGTITEKAPALLAVLERHGASRVDPVHEPSRPDDAIDADRQLRDIGVLGAESSGPPPPGTQAQIRIGTVGFGAFLDGSAVNDAVEQAANDNVGKLAKADADERHLFVWADWSDQATEGSLFLGRLPTKPPSLPHGIDTVWVATWAPHAIHHCYASILWRTTPGAGWKTISPPDALCDVEGVTGDSSPRQAEDTAFGEVQHELIAAGKALRRRLRLPNS